MKRLAQRVMAALIVGMVAASLPGPAVAHPLGNATVSRGVAVTLAVDAIAVDYIIDMAEIPAFAAIQDIDADGDDAVSAEEAVTYATAACDEAVGGLQLWLDGEPLGVQPGADPALSFPPGVGGLETLRLECHATAEASVAAGARHAMQIVDGRDDGRPGWREVTISAGAGIDVLDSDVPQLSPSGGLTAYPEDLLTAPIDVRAGSATFAAGAANASPATVGTLTRAQPSDPLASLLTAQADSGGGVGTLLALLVSMALGAAHAVSPGHGKALIAAALVGSRGTARQAVGLGLTVAASHTVGVLALGLLVLGAGRALAPDRVLAWMSLVAGGCVVGVGCALLWRAALHARRREHDHASADDHPRPHPHSHPHDMQHDGLATRAVVGLGLFGGLVPSSSAVIVLLLAVTTGQVVLGLGLIAAFGLGMAGVLGAFALLSTWLGTRVLAAEVVVRRPVLARIGTAIPIVSAAAVVGAGTLMTVGALTQVL